MASFSLRADENLMEAVKRVATMERRSANTMIEVLLREALEARKIKVRRT